ncbi:unnamed protein product [Closterium sp. NIES-54]
MYITLYFIVTRLHDSLRSVKNHFLSLEPTSHTVDLLEQHLLEAETSAVATSLILRMPGMLLRSAAAARARVAGVVEGAAGVVVGVAVQAVAAVEVVAAVGVVEGVEALVAAVEAAVGVAVVAAVAVVAVGQELSVEVPEKAGSSDSSVGARPLHPSSFVSGCFSVGRLGRPHWAELLRSGVAIFDLDYDAIFSAMYALSASAEGDCHRCVPPDPGIDTAALGASESVLPGAAPAEALYIFTLDSGASRCFFRDSTTLTPLPAPVPLRLAHPSGGPVVAHSSTVLPCPAVLSGLLSGLHLPSFSMNLVSTAALQDAMVITTTPRGQRVLICTSTRTGRHLATFTRQPGSSLYTLATEPPQVATSAQVSASGQVAPPCSCRLLSHQTLLWHHCLGHPSLPRLRSMHSRLLVSGLPSYLPPLPPSPALPCLPCVEGRQRAVRLQLHERFRAYLPVLRLHSDRGVMEVARTSMIHAATPHFLWPFAVRYAAHQLNLWPRLSFPETSPTLCRTGKVGDASVFRDVTFDESVPFNHLFLYLSAPPPPLPLFLAPGPPPVDPLIPQGPAPSGVSQGDPLPGTAPAEVAVGSRAPRGAASGGVAPKSAELGVAESEGAGSGGAEPGGE